MAQVEMYSSRLCPYCIAARRLLKKKGIIFQLITIWRVLGIKLPTANFTQMKRRSGGQTTVPQIFVDGAYLGDEEALFALEREGKLEAVLGPAC
jgi:glutaredoxin 3